MKTVASRYLWITDEQKSVAANGNGKHGLATTNGATNGQHKNGAAKKQTADGKLDLSAVVETVKQHVQAVAKERAKELTPTTNIVELGLDSLERMEIISSLESEYGGQFPEEILLDIETVAQVSDAIVEHMPIGKAGSREVPPEHYQFDRMIEYVQLQRNKQLLESTGIPNPYFKAHEGVTRDTAKIDGKELISFATYNYIGMSGCLLYTSPSPRDATLSRMPSSA